MTWKTILLSTGESRYSVIMDDGEETLAWIYFHPQPGGYLVAGGDLLGWLQEQQDFED